jgi:hypothetical protein
MLRRTLWCLNLAVALGPTILAQNASLSGRVFDQTQLAVPGASVFIAEQRTSLQRSVQTNGSGLYSLPDLPPGTYDVKVLATGFESQERRNLILDVAQQAQLDFSLEIGQMTQTLPVSGGYEHLQTNEASVSNLVERQLTANMPLNGRSFQNLITLAAGVTLSNAQNSNGQFVVNGLRGSANSFIIDGVNAVSTITGYQSAGGNNAGYNAAGGTNGMVTVDALEEFRVVTSSFAPEFGRNPGAHVLLVTRSGTNLFHGTSFNYLRNDKLDAADWFVNQAGQSKPRLRSNDFGGVFGGPVVRNRIFFFISYEGQRLVEPKFTITTVPSLAARQGASTLVQPFLNAFPVPNGPDLGNNRAEFSAGYSNPLTTDSTLFKVDQVVTDRLRSFATFTWAPSSKASRSNSGTASLADRDVQHLRERSLTVGLTYVPVGVLVSDLRLNFADNVNESRFTMDSFGGAVVPANDLLLPGTTPANYYSFINLGDPGGDLFGGSIGTFKQRQINVVDGTTFVHGTHQLKFGEDYRLLLPLIRAAGDEYFQFNGIAGLINNQLDAFHNSVPSRARIEMNSMALYTQDTWMMSSQVNLTYGLRWDFNSVPHSRDRNNGDLVQLFGNYARSNVIVGIPGSPLWNQRYDNLAPRIGAAWVFRKHPGGETVLRAGGGLFYDTGIAEASSQPWVSGYPAGQATVLLNSHLPVSASAALLPAVNLSNPPPGNRFFTFAPNLRAPRVWEWNVTLQQAIGSDQTLTLAYVGSDGRRLLYSVAYPIVTANIYSVVYTDDSGSSSYHALQLHYERRLSRNIAANLSYTWGHSIDTNSSDTATYVPGVFEPPLSNRADSDFDIRQLLHGAVSWNLPGVHGPATIRALTAGWGLDGIFTAQTGPPVNVTVHRDIGFGGYDFRPDLVGGVPEWINDPSVAGGKRINPVALAVPLFPVQGDLGRNAFRGFNLVQADLSVRRTFGVTDKISLTFRADLFNALNHPNFANPISFIGSGLFGISTTSVANSEVGGGAFGLNSVFHIGGPRAVQVSLKLQF